MITYYIGAGSSHPRAHDYLDCAYEKLKNYKHIYVLAQSPHYPNPAFGGQTFFRFVNAAFKIQTCLQPDALWFVLHSIETVLGRVRVFKNGPRTLDLDILWSSLGSFKSPYLNLPHPEFKKRPFALKPAADIGFR